MKRRRSSEGKGVLLVPSLALHYVMSVLDLNGRENFRFNLPSAIATCPKIELEKPNVINIKIMNLLLLSGSSLNGAYVCSLVG